MFLSLLSIMASLNLRAGVAAWYQPTVNTTWQVQYSGNKLDLSWPATVYDIDGFNASSALIADLHSKGHKVVCYFSAGSLENYAPDASSFPVSVAGKIMDGWPDEKWLDIRQLTTLQTIMSARAKIGKNKGCDGIDWDNVDAYTNDSGFPLTYANQLAYNRMLAKIAHDLDMAVGLKNDLDQIPDLVSSFDFAVNEQCQQYNECYTLLPFIAAGKPVWAISYAGITKTASCALPNKLGFQMLLKHENLDAAGYPCWQQTVSQQVSSTKPTPTSISKALGATAVTTITTSKGTTTSQKQTTQTTTSSKSSTATTKTTLSTSTKICSTVAGVMKCAQSTSSTSKSSTVSPTQSSSSKSSNSRH